MDSQKRLPGVTQPAAGLSHHEIWVRSRPDVMGGCHVSAPERWSGGGTSQDWSGEDPLFGLYCWKKLPLRGIRIAFQDCCGG